MSNLSKLILNSNGSSKSNTEFITERKKVNINNKNNAILATLNINSVSKFEELQVIGQEIFDILIINKDRCLFSAAQFRINCFSTSYKLD